MKQAEKNRLSTNQIITAAINEFAHYGYVNASLNRLCRENGISKGKLYHYFDSKDELYYQCVNFIFFDFAAMLQNIEIDKTKPVFENLHYYYKQLLEYWTTHPESCLIIKRASLMFDSKDFKQVKEGQKKYIMTAKQNLLEITRCGNCNAYVSNDELFEVLKAVNENLFMREIGNAAELAIEGKNEEVQKKKKEIMALYDRMINVLLHGIL